MTNLKKVFPAEKANEVLATLKEKNRKFLQTLVKERKSKTIENPFQTLSGVRDLRQKSRKMKADSVNGIVTDTSYYNRGAGWWDKTRCEKEDVMFKTPEQEPSTGEPQECDSYGLLWYPKCRTGYYPNTPNYCVWQLESKATEVKAEYTSRLISLWREIFYSPEDRTAGVAPAKYCEDVADLASK
jgi:hypothetical protein